MGGYEYDESGQYNFFLLSITLICLVPWTWYSVNQTRNAASRIKPPCAGWNVKDESVTRTRKAGPRVKKSNVALAVGWAFLAFTTYRASNIKLDGIIYDPFAILGISSSLDEKAIKRHYKRLSLKFHPDKLKLTGNQTKEDVDAKFVELTKAYKVLTDETIRRNFELYGHPDGKQDFGMGIAIPKSFIAAQNNGYIIGVYAILFGVALPFFVGRWWFGSKRVTKDGILNVTAATLYLNMKEDMSFARAVEIVSASTEMEQYLAKSTAIKSSEFDRLQNQVKEQLKTVAGERMDGQLFRQKSCQRAAVLLYGHLFRIPINSTALLADQQAVVKEAYRVASAFANIVLAHSWLGAYNNVVTLQQALAQACHPALPAILQLPHVTPTMAKASKHKSIEEFVQASDAERKRDLIDMDENQLKQAIDVAEHWPKVELIHAGFKVIGERIVTPGSIVQLIVKVKITPPKRSPKPQPNGIESSLLAPPAQEGGSGVITPVDHVRVEEQDIQELVKQRLSGDDGEEPTGYAHAPRLPFDKVPSWSMYVGDQKLDRIFIAPSKFTDIGSSQVRTLKMSHQAPGGDGLYTFQLFIRSDCYLGTDIKKDMQMSVEPLDSLNAAEQDLHEDDISDPEEDTIAGQMAAMRGQNVKRIAEEEDDDTSGSEDGYDSDEAGGNTTSDEE